MYEQINLWKRISETSAIRFQCIRRASDGMFAVQNADYFYKPFKPSMLIDSNARFIELLLESEPTIRCEWFATLSDAVAKHEEDFR